MSISTGADATSTNFNNAFVSRTIDSSMAGSLTVAGHVIKSIADALTAHAGGGQGSATALTKDLNIIGTCASANDSAIIPPSVAGYTIYVMNRGAQTLAVYPSSGEQIDALAANISITIPTGQASMFVCRVSGQWVSQRLAPKDITFPASGTLATSTDVSSAITTHVAAAGAHAATAITNTPSGNLAATTVQAALDELQTDIDGRTAKSTLTTKGDLYVATGSAVPARQAVGADGTALVADSTQSTGVKWAVPVASRTRTVTAKVSNYTLTTSDDFVLGNGATVFTLPACAGNAGLAFTIKHVSTGTLTVDGNASETIDGALTVILNTYDSIDIVTNGTGWYII